MISRLFEAQVQRSPDGVAVGGPGALTYAQLNRLANRIAAAILRARGRAEEPVALLLEKDASFIAAFLGVLKAGKICVPLDPSYPDARNRFVLEDTEAAVVVTHDVLAARVPTIAPSAVVPVNVDALDLDLRDDDPDVALTGESLATILYTSGSTGHPKGVLQNHGNTLHNVRNLTRSLDITGDDRFSLLASGGTMGGVRDILAAVLTGASVVPYDISRLGVASIGGWLDRERITILNVVVTVFRHFIASLQGSEVFSTVRVVKSGSEPAAPGDLEAFRRHFAPTCRFWAGFGTTETGNITQLLITRETTLPEGRVPIGQPLDGVEVLVLDDTGQSMGSGHAGEVVVRSAYLALGYWRRPELTARVFRPDPDDGHVRRYHTGDQGRLLPDGSLELLGRRDAVVKVRGQRIELSEVEQALQGLPGVHQAVVRAFARDGDDPRLAAYIAPRMPPGPTAADLRRGLQRQLPGYMVPSAFVVLPALPSTHQGKVDRRALPEPDWSRIERSVPFQAPRTPVETTLATLWAEVLGVEAVGIDDDFLELGGHSLAATRLVWRVGERFGVSASLGELLRAHTVAEMAIVVTCSLASHVPQGKLESLLNDLDVS